jgi:hypothetical protein
MKFRDYCMVIMGDINRESTIPYVIKISDSNPNILDAKGIIITTFMSVMEPKELTDYFKSLNFNFLLFDLNDDTSGFNFTKVDIQEGLFGFLNQDRGEYLTNKSQELLVELTANSESNVTKYINKDEDVLSLPIDDVDNLTSTERNEWINKILSKGVNKLSTYDKKLLQKLSK